MSRLIVELAASSVRGLHVQGRGRRLRVRRWAVESVRASEDVACALRRLMPRLGARPASVAVVMPRDQSLTRLVRLPTSDLCEAAQMLSLAGHTQFPYPPDKTVMEGWWLGSQADTTTVQLIAARRETVERQLALLRQVGLEPDVLTTSAWGLASWVGHVGRSGELPEAVFLVHVDVEQTDLVLVSRGQPLFSRALSYGASDWQQTFEALTRLLEEIQRSFASIRQEWPDLPLRTVILTGCGPLQQWRSIFEEHLGTSVLVQDVWQIPEGVSGDKVFASAAVVWGVAMATDTAVVNVLPSDVQRARSRQRHLRTLIQTGWLWVIAGWLGVGLLAVQTHRRARDVARLSGALHELAVSAEPVVRQEQSLRLVEQLLASRRETAVMLAELFKTVPADVHLAQLTVDGARGDVVLRGTAPTMQQVLGFLGQLQASPVWSRVELRSSSRHRTQTTSQTEFEFVLQ